MSDKPIAFLVYALLGCLLALTPTLFVWLAGAQLHVAAVPAKETRHPFAANISCAIILILVVLVIAPAFWTVAALGIAAAWAAWRMKDRSIGPVLLMLGVLVAYSKVVWWDPILGSLSISSLLVAAFLFVVAVELVALRGSGSRNTEIAAWLIFGVLCLFMNFSTGLYWLDEIVFTTWHHWSSYVGPAELMWAGARVFYDTPMQYGLGPTALIAATCSIDCWTGMYFIVGVANTLYAATIAYAAFRLLGRRRPIGLQIVVLAAVAVACLIYVAYPPAPATPAIAPSTGGLRFLPVALLIAYLSYAADRRWSGSVRLVGQILWILGLLWAPESAFQVTFVWWSYYLWRSGIERTEGASLFASTIGAGLKLLAVALATVAVFTVAYFALYGVLPTRDGVLAYVLYPPGPAPFDFRGMFVFVAGVFLLTCFCVLSALGSEEHKVFSGRALPALLALYAAASYYLGRSIDNNMLNLMPFVVLALVVAVVTPNQRAAKVLGLTGLCCIIAATPTFGWHHFWKPAIQANSAMKLQPWVVDDSFTFENPDTATALDRRERQRNPLVKSSDIDTAIKEIWSRYNEPVTLMAPPLLLVTSHSEPWSAMHSPANFWSLPSQVRRTFLTRAMGRFHRAGWILVQEDTADEVAKGGRDLVKDFDAVYTRDIAQPFGSYTAIRYLPKDR